MSSKPSSPALIETKEPNGSAHASSSTSEEAEEQEAQVGVKPGRGRGTVVAVVGAHAGSGVWAPSSGSLLSTGVNPVRWERGGWCSERHSPGSIV